MFFFDNLSYQTISFLIFFAVFLAVYLVMPFSVPKRIVLLIGNFYFYYCMGGLPSLIVVIGSALVVYIFSFFISQIYSGYENKKDSLEPKKRKSALTPYKRAALPFCCLGVLFVLSILVYTKIGGYFGFKAVSDIRKLKIGRMLVPLGLSYYTFSMIGYLLDIYWRKAKFDPNFFKLLICSTYFPIIMQGPITRYDKMIKKLSHLPGFEFRRVAFGLQRMAWGFFKKLVVADRLAIFTASFFQHPEEFAGVEVVIVIFFCAITLYCDFSGCMDIVCGASEAIGITLDQNFRQPFFAKTAAEFWRRWHITLGAWFRDYVYMPIAMNSGRMRTAGVLRKKVSPHLANMYSSILPLAIVWFLTGLWHGTGTDYMVWGLWWGGIIILSTILEPVLIWLTKLFHINRDSFSWQLFQMVRTFMIFCVGRMLTIVGTGDLRGFRLIWSRLIVEPRLQSLVDKSLYTHGLNEANYRIAVMAIGVVWIVDMIHEHIETTREKKKGTYVPMELREIIAEQILPFRWVLYLGVIAAVVIFGIYGSAFDASSFMYAGF